MSQAKTAKLADLTQQRSAHTLRWRFSLILLLMVLDFLVYAVVSFILIEDFDELRQPVIFRFDVPMNAFWYIVICSLIYVCCLKMSGVYHRHVLGDGYELNVRLLKAAVMDFCLVCSLNYVLESKIGIRMVVLTSLFAWIATMIMRMIVRFIVTRRRRKGAYTYPTVIVGSPEGIGQALKFINNRKQLNYKAIAVCPIRVNRKTGLIEADDDYEALKTQMKGHGGHGIMPVRYGENMGERFAQLGAQTIMVTDVLDRFSDNLNMFSLQMEAMNLEVALVTSAVDIAGHATRIQNRNGLTIMTIYLPQYSPYEQIKKRIFDIVVSSVALVVSSPIMAIVALAIKMEDGGPVFYKQERIGLRGKPFYIHKFRSMYVNADARLEEVLKEQGQELGARYKLKHDPRITKVGAFIRKTSLDELPQFFDSFRGAMSVVGPRPQRDFEVREYDRVYASRLLVKPGITGPWQVSGRNDLDEAESRQLDVSYVQDWSVMGDIVYILRTVGTVLRPSGAY
ncbi:sugar transferase [Bifidobacterium gallicum]|uniref:Exopolysaccharide biosynthesis polyprenyl glycosylphosphotransferase n=1 Tax=Bifidobacterium gallicum DSM 20093 = LMG 11596 TaxID=561180 RepID=D1NWL8_9BIFI|nr:sugar transferase [Bifidobacterium gallicum]EFA22177.1 exopolysaccharide biosynthesis polyprenyl glycosylphosphotransferase [Bifidobacterium gallicum DSM 20093 = LMG 11596]KFI59083.1 galactosyl transferase [Bifidobacterium gallicum DSM 20093 = LMG 11596]